MSLFGRIHSSNTQALILGLGNPGLTYDGSRHNAGFDTLDVISKKTGIPVNKTQSRSKTGFGIYNGHRIALAKPMTYMNLSGDAAVALVSWFKPQQLIVLFDDIDLPLGTMRIRSHGSAGTHNGMRSIIASLGAEDFARVRIGVGKPPPNWDLKDWVLTRYHDDDIIVAKDMFEKAADAALLILEQGIDEAMSRYNKKHIGI